MKIDELEIEIKEIKQRHETLVLWVMLITFTGLITFMSGL